ncbi:mycothiol system anti-sigma-R factor [Corynebacterium heidelbergense]|uniref:Mycothiol system anti-sigma-R factor n=1 Tax=Corynebacterium heidelbergense TaxID=2055947 RepID=A0A364V9Y0_9CORY|nr:mycothiol system anti-sigma-R factor [Corynebacterium heidelbergense]RAV33418.1 mycothiol system anti-sigma-R factor [Corynebacterium heidelbergense]WCZ37173.1 Anti-sigma factor RshA [Corynebacterium heidelbergense]
MATDKHDDGAYLSSVDPTRSDCSNLMDVLYEYVDGGCDENLRALLQHHVDKCPECLEMLGIEMAVRQLLRSTCNETAPQELHSRIRAQLRVRYEYRE